jgi:hypothetical protein
MKGFYFCVMVAFVTSLAASPSADAGTQEGAVIALHAKAHTSDATTLCTTWKPTIPCQDYTTQWPVGSEADIYLVVAHAPDATKGIAGASCGIDYVAAEGVGVDVFGWTLCAYLEFTGEGVNGEWPAAGSGSRITWMATTDCQRTVIGIYGVHAVCGVFHVYAYTDDTFRVTPNLNEEPPELAVADCNASTTYFPTDNCGGCDSHCGAVGFGQDQLGNPCSRCGPVERSTWGAIKRAY